ncbi:uncharacterized protein LOC123705739 [Colias croceus]|uniref:uncharacterized protein LOC123705739 n=1 Tax=Colias crocea TaxID=72248 RepID=UPI001E280D15|nr:uncharacterized protein LOC123705739 [Colias croceus]XP_045510685.1 uncharacterized protein LOC123705739 [Colias croceus]
MTRNRDNESAFYVVQFIELPFEGVDDYVCVPRAWIIKSLGKATNDRAVVAYPNNEDPFDTRDRAKRKERINDEWRFYMATIKYESNSFDDAEVWIATRNNYGAVVEETSKVTDTQPELSINKKLRSVSKNHSSKSNDNLRKPLPRILIKRPIKSKSRKEINEKRLKLDESAQSSSAVVNDSKVEPRSPKRKQPAVIIQDIQSMENSHAEKSVVSHAEENTEPRSKTPHTDQTEQALSSPVKDVDKRIEVTNVDDKDHSQRVKKPEHNNNMSQANSSSNATDVTMTATQPSTADKQSTQPNQYNHQECIPDRSSLSNFLPQIENVRSLSNVDDHKLPANEISSQKVSSDYEGLCSPKIIAHLYSHMNGGRRLVPIQRPVEKTIGPTKIKSLAIAAQNPLNSIAQTRPLSTSSVEKLPVVIQNQSDLQVSRTHTRNSRDQTVPLRSIGMSSQEIHGPRINFDPNNVFQSVNNAAATSQQPSSLSHKPPSYIQRLDGHQNSVAHEQYYTNSYQNQYLPTNQDNFQNSTHLSNSTYQTPEVAQQRPMQPNHLNSQQQPQRPKLRIDISIEAEDVLSLQGATRKTPSPILTNFRNSLQQAVTTSYNNFLSNNPQLQARISPRSTGDNNEDLMTSPQNVIASETRDRQNTEIPSYSMYQPSRIQHTAPHDNRYQNLCKQQQLVHHSTRTNSKRTRVHFIDDATRLPVTGSYLNDMDNACQINECTVDETLSPYHAVTSDSDAVTDQEVISDHEMSSDEAPAETANNAYGTANDPWRSSADRPTAAQNSTARSYQMNPRIILEQQMLDNFSTLFTQMGSILRHTNDMYNTLRSSILDTAMTYEKLLGAVEEFNSAGNTANNASPSSNPVPDVPQPSEERHTTITASASTSIQNQHSNDVANKTPKKKPRKLFRFVLPPEYDAHDSRWTLNYPEYLPGLVELVPESQIYVSYGNLKYCQQVSKDCPSLARRLLTEVFNRNSLSVCSSLSETAKASNSVGSNIRPDLDDHACSVLLNFVIEHGLQRDWNTDLKPILDMIHSKMQEIRFKYGIMVEC